MESDIQSNWVFTPEAIALGTTYLSVDFFKGKKDREYRHVEISKMTSDGADTYTRHERVLSYREFSDVRQVFSWAEELAERLNIRTIGVDLITLDEN